MFYPESLIGNSIIRSDIESLSEEFTRGDFFSTQLSEFVLNNIALTKQGNYTDYLNQIKEILNYSKINYYYNLMIIKSSAKITEEQKVVMVRYINICVAHNNKIILFNNNIIYIPEDLKRKYGEEAINTYVNSIYRKYINKRRTKYILRKIQRFRIKRFIPFIR